MSPILALALPAAVSRFNGSSLALVAGIVAVLRRRQAVGGWLFYFFCQVVLALLLIAATTHWNLFLPSAWSGPDLYFLYTLSNLPRIALLAEIALVSAMLVGTREWQWVSGLKYALAAYAFLTVVKLLVDAVWFPESARLDLLSLSFPCVWVLYFDISRRVRRVFLEKSWK